MQFKISSNTLKNTIKCKKNFSCLSKQREGVCEVAEYVYRNVQYLQCAGEADCIYRTPLEAVYVCACPTRREIYERYRI
jgi:hypothetical protein